MRDPIAYLGKGFGACLTNQVNFYLREYREIQRPETGPRHRPFRFLLAQVHIDLCGGSLVAKQQRVPENLIPITTGFVDSIGHFLAGYKQTRVGLDSIIGTMNLDNSYEAKSHKVVLVRVAAYCCRQ